MQDIVLIGGGGHSKAVIDVIESTGAYRIAGIVEQRGSPIAEVLGYPVLGCDEALSTLRAQYPCALVTVGQITTAQPRIRLFDAALAAGFTLPVIVSPRAYVARTAVLGPGTIVMHAAQIGPDARIGANVIVNTRALVEHDVVVGDHCHLATSATINGGVVIGDACLIGSGALCREGMVIGSECVVGMGARVLKMLPNRTFFIGG